MERKGAAMWFAIGVFGASFAGLMCGILIALGNLDVKWSDAVTAIGTVVAAIGTVGTLIFQAAQNAKLQRQQRVQALIQQHAEADLVGQWFEHLEFLMEHLGALVPGTNAASFAQQWREDVNEFNDEIKRESSRITSTTGHGLYRALTSYVRGLERISSLLTESNSRWERETSGTRYLNSVRQAATQSKKHALEWKDVVEMDLAKARSEAIKKRPSSLWW